MNWMDLNNGYHKAIKILVWDRIERMKYLDDGLLFVGCGLILYGTWQVNPVATWFVGGGMCIVIGILIGIGSRKL